MKSRIAVMNGMHGVIDALKVSNQEQQIIIDDLLRHGFEQNRKIAHLREQIKKLLQSKHTVII